MKNKFIVFVLVVSLLLISAVVPASADSTTGSAVRTRILSSTLRSAASLSWHDNFSSDDALVIKLDTDRSIYVVPNSYYPNPLFIPCYFTADINGSTYVYYGLFSISDYVGSSSDSHRVEIYDNNGVHYFNNTYTYNDLTYFGFTNRLGLYGSITLNSSLPVFSSSSDMIDSVGAFIFDNSLHWSDSPIDISSSISLDVLSDGSSVPFVAAYCPSSSVNNNAFYVFPDPSVGQDFSISVLSGSATVSGVQSYVYDDVTYYYRYFWISNTDIISSVFPYYESASLVQSNIADFISSNPISSDPFSSFTLPYGNVLYLDLGVGSEYDLILSSSMPEISSLVGDPWPDSQYYFFADSLPTLDTYFYPSDGTYIDWQKGDDRNFFGQTYTAITRLSGTASHRYLAIINPFDYANSSTVTFGQYVTNGSVKVERISSGTTIYSYPLFSEISNGVVTSVISDTNGGTGTASSSGGTIQTVTINDNSVDYSSPDGGGNMSSVAESTQSLIQKLRDTLKSFFDSILELLGKPIEHIQSLINAGSAFFQELSGLWSWLPEEVSGILTSTLIIMVAVAVFKVFL